jgi:hypothetical protein
MYVAQARQQLSQGDILSQVALIDSAAPAAPAVNRNIIVLSHNCEIDKQSNEIVIVAALFPLENAERHTRGISGDIKRGRVYNTMFLMSYGAMSESYVDFRYIYRVNKSYLNECIVQGLRIVSLDTLSKDALCIFFERYLFRKTPTSLDSGAAH